MKKEFLLPIAVLFSICLVVSAALGLTNSVTAPLIEEAERAAAEAARLEVLPEASGFESVYLEGLPQGVTNVYRAQNGVGFVFMLSTKGYGGELRLICGVNAEGNITATKVLVHAETQGLGSKITSGTFSGQFIGKDSELSDVSAISGATISSNAYINAIKDAFAALEKAKEVG
ncbi:MAG TPA: FMN-binding protein [Clostridia bacterium]|jgi:electron transport complex protein RnfG|nr:FMN-binding protein [Clostridia bacterium]